MRSEIQRETVEDKRKKWEGSRKMRGIIKGRGRKAAGENRTQLDGLSAFVLRNTQRQP